MIRRLHNPVPASREEQWRGEIRECHIHQDREKFLRLISPIKKQYWLNVALDIIINPPNCENIIDLYRFPEKFSGMIDDVLRMGADVNFLGRWDRTPLVNVVLAIHAIDLVLLLLERGANMRKISTRGLTAIQWACKMEAKRDDNPISRIFVVRGAKLEEFEIKESATQNHKALLPNQQTIDFYRRIAIPRAVVICFLGLRHKVPLLRGLGKDIMRYLAKLIYQTRGQDIWDSASP